MRIVNAYNEYYIEKFICWDHHESRHLVVLWMFWSFFQLISYQLPLAYLSEKKY